MQNCVQAVKRKNRQNFPCLIESWRSGRGSGKAAASWHGLSPGLHWGMRGAVAGLCSTLTQEERIYHEWKQSVRSYAFQCIVSALFFCIISLRLILGTYSGRTWVSFGECAFHSIFGPSRPPTVNEILHAGGSTSPQKSAFNQSAFHCPPTRR
jgi:hypothetical protein